MRRIINATALRTASRRVGKVGQAPLQSLKFSTDVPAVKNEEEKKDEGVVSSLGLNDWKFALPAAMFIGIPAIHNEVFTIDAEFQVCACFILFCSTCYTQLGPMITKSFNETTSGIRDDLSKLDDVIESQITSGIAQSTAALEMENVAKLMYATKDQIDSKTVENKNLAEKHFLHESIMRKLDKLSALEESTNSNVRTRMIQAINADVMSKVTSDKKMRDDALTEAIKVLGDGKLGKDVVGKSFSDSVKKYKDEYVKMPADKDELFIQLEKDMAAICTEVEVGSGGNIYDLNHK